MGTDGPVNYSDLVTCKMITQASIKTKNMLLLKATRNLLKINNGEPKNFGPFFGGNSIPLEEIRFGM